MDFSPRKKLCQRPEYDMECCIQDSVTKVQEFLTRLAGMKEITSWRELFDEILSEKHCFAFRFRKDLVEETVQCLMNTLLDPGCDSVDAASRIVSLYCKMLEGLDVVSEARARPTSPNSEIHYSIEAAFSVLRVDIDHCPCLLQNATTEALERVDDKLMRVLLTYGLVQPAENLDVLDSYGLYNILRCIGVDLFERGLEEDEILEEDQNLEEMSVNGGPMTSQKRRLLSRISHIVRSLDGVRMALRGEEGRAEEYADILEQLNATHPDPLVTAKEVREFLLLHAADKPDEVDRMVQEFVRLFGEQGTYEPRSLTHLSRCTVRETIVENVSVTLPCAVKSLRIPGRIQDYVLCHPGWSSSQEL